MTTDLESVLAAAAELAVPDETVAEIRRRRGIDQRRDHIGRADAPLTRPERARLIEDREVQPTPALSATRGWLEAATTWGAPGPSLLVLSGPEGTGRTFAAAWAIAQEGGRYRDVDELVHLYRRATVARATLRDRAELERWWLARVLVVARLGAERSPAGVREALSRLLDTRDEPRSHLTVILTELAPAALLEHAGAHYDARTNERLRIDATTVDLRGAR